MPAISTYLTPMCTGTRLIADVARRPGDWSDADLRWFREHFEALEFVSVTPGMYEVRGGGWPQPWKPGQPDVARSLWRAVARPGLPVDVRHLYAGDGDRPDKRVMDRLKNQTAAIAPLAPLLAKVLWDGIEVADGQLVYCGRPIKTQKD